MSRRNIHMYRAGRSIAVAACLSIALAACSSGSKDSTAASNDTSGSTRSAASTSGASTSDFLAAAQAAVTKLSQPPTKIPITTPLTAKPATAKLVTFVGCNVQCSLIGEGVHAAANAVGWSFKQLLFSPADPSTMIGALRQALQDHPAAVLTGALPEVVWASVLPAYKAAGVPLVVFSANAKVVDPVIGSVADLPQFESYGRGLADWFIADSKGKGHAFFSTVSGLAGLQAGADGFASEVKEKCPDCKLTTGNLSISDANTGVASAATVSALQRDRSIDYAFTVNGNFFNGLAQKLASVGLTKVKIGGILGTAANQTNVKAGTEAAYMNYSITIMGWMMMDVALRHDQGMPLDPGDGDTPSQLLITGGNFAVANSMDSPSDYASQFKALWKVS